MHTNYAPAFPIEQFSMTSQQAMHLQFYTKNIFNIMKLSLFFHSLQCLSAFSYLIRYSSLNFTKQ